MNDLPKYNRPPAGCSEPEFEEKMKKLAEQQHEPLSEEYKGDVTKNAHPDFHKNIQALQAKHVEQEREQLARDIAFDASIEPFTNRPIVGFSKLVAEPKE